MKKIKKMKQSYIVYKMKDEDDKEHTIPNVPYNYLKCSKYMLTVLSEFMIFNN